MPDGLDTLPRKTGVSRGMKKVVYRLLFLSFLALTATQLSALLFQQGVAWQLSAERPEDTVFRAQSLSGPQLSRLREAQRQSGMAPGELLTILRSGASESAAPGDVQGEALVRWKRLMMRFNPSGYEKMSRAYGAIWNDVECFPVAADGVIYENSWMFERNYGGKRGHEGTDLIPPENLPGHYPVVSMTDGVVEKVGWLPLGGYRIGIRSPSGGYFYYAHLDSYDRVFTEGEEIAAGTVLGRMGDTGYGPEGTRGRFAVHLHLGIYLHTDETEELSVNPYWVLRYLQMTDGFRE